MILTPNLTESFFGKNVTFRAFVEAKLNPPLEARWIKNGLTETIDIFDKKYYETKGLPSPRLVINDVTFDDKGYYQLQIRISEGWCTSKRVHFRKVWGILQYNERCNLTHECDESRKNLQCWNSKCLCQSSYYHQDQKCFLKSYLRAVFVNWNITTSEMNVKWRHPATHSDLIQSYTITIRDNGGSIKGNDSVGNKTSYSFESNFDYGHLYYFEITSVVHLSDPVETIYVEHQLDLVVEPLPPGAIDRNASNFHPEKLHLKWAAPGNRTRVDLYRIYIDGYYYDTSSTEVSISRRLEPGTNYTVTMYTKSWYGYSYGKSSKPNEEQITTLRTPKVIITESSSVYVPYLSTLEIKASVQNYSDFPLTLETRWQRNGRDINITDIRYTGSSLDLFNPTLVIDRVDFEHEDDTRYQCIAVNSEGLGTSTTQTWVYVQGSIKFLEPCNRTKECLVDKDLTCSSNKCLCDSSYYHKNKVCYSISYLRARSIHVQSSTCDMTITWNPPYRDQDLVSGYQVITLEYPFITSEAVSVGNETAYTTPCKLQPGRRYATYIRSNIELSDPIQEKDADSGYYYTILEPLKPGSILRSLSNFSADNLYLRWEASGQNSLVNRYRVTIGDRSQQTIASVPEIYWGELLLPVTLYNVTITAISYGFISNYPSYGTRESLPSTDWVETEESQYTGKAYMSYGTQDYVLQGDDVTSGPLRSPTTVYVGDGSDGGFSSVVIGSNGVIGLGDTFNSISVHDMDSIKLKEKRIICPFWTDLSSGDTVGKVYYNTYRRGVEGPNVDSMFMEKADNIVKKHFRDLRDFKATWLVKVTWENMTLYGNKNQKVTFQCFLITDGENTFTVINYIDVNLKPILNRKISIGYRYKQFFTKNSFTNQKGAFRMSVVPGNRGERGFWIYKMTEGVELRRDEKECILWHSYNIDNKIHNKLSGVLNGIECPCDPRLLRFDPRYTLNRFDRINRLLCYASMTQGTNVECCFKMYANTEDLGPLQRSLPLAGTVVNYNPFFERYQYNNYDLKPKDQCCGTGHCDLYYEVRPVPRCYWRSPFQPGINFGDPHITTLDGLDYTFNGYGEYTMIRINTSTTTFELQARTDLATTANGTTINATIFSAFVAQDQTGSKVQIEMSRNKTGMIIRGNGVDLTTKFKNANYTFRTPNVSLQWVNQTISATFLKSYITMKISLGKRFLICETLVNKKYKGLVLGLMGNFDGNKTNDFILPNGTVLTENATKTERGIFYNFGHLWSVNEKSTLFHYDDGLMYKNFSHPEFVPLFTDEVDTNRINEAKKKCGSKPSKACISDYLATGDIALAESSGNKEHDSKSDVAVIENESPQISGNTTVHVIINKEVEMKFNASDDGEETPAYKVLKQPDNFVLDNETGIARWTPKTAGISEISIIAVDTQGAQSPSLDVSIIMCSGCSDHGDCDYINVIPTQNDRFHKAACSCNIGYSGDGCESETDACLQSPCPLGRNCTDLSPEEEVRLERGYNCSECPTGYTDVKNKCQDVDECKSTESNACDATKETCVNADGSYECNCLEGYRKLDDTCNDINECIEGTSGCQQLCKNDPGSFRCLCHPGFSLNEDKSTCNKSDDDLCTNFEKECEYACSTIDGTTQCICPSGYHLADNGIHCTDINECSLATSPCDQECLNKNGSFQCACRPGYSLKADKTSCSVCELPNYGENCSQVCECGPGIDRCDPVSGCVCLQGWTGKNCSLDIDECQRNPTICGTNKLCHNTEGSYQCDCAKGFKLIDDNCEDIDECNDASLNDCPVATTECKNTHGNYTCECKEGYQEKNSVCEDIDECKTSIHGCSQKCENAAGGYSCLCFFGFTLKEDRKTCEKNKDSCASFPELKCSYGCKQAAYDDHSGVCFCETGYKLAGDNKTCIDINECKDVSTCDQNCTNKNGSFACGCAIGYSLQNDGKSCKECSQYFYGENCETPCKCGRGASVCHHVDGCICKPGWRGETCEEDIDECKSNPCAGEHVTCLNAPGSFRCQCIPGFQNSTGVCQDIDECQDPLACHQKCTNFEGNYTCSCKDGYELINTKDCQDIDECRTAECHQCSNRPGGFTCSCYDGYRLNATTQDKCYNIDECVENLDNCSQAAHCTDTIGGFNCSCFRGFQGNGYDCEVCKDSTFGEQCSDKCTCVVNNTMECSTITGECQCKAGWRGANCSEDVDECKENIRKCDTNLYQTCINTPGSSHCQCRYGGQNLSNCIRPKEPHKPNKTDVKIRTEIKFDINIQMGFPQNSEKLRTDFENSLADFYKKGDHMISAVFVLSIRLGSAIVDTEVIGTNTDTNDVEHYVATRSSEMLSGKERVTVAGKDVNVLEMIPKHDNGTLGTPLTPVSSPCDVFISIGACMSDEKCQSSAGETKCIKEKSESSDMSTLIVVLGVGIPLLITSIVLIIICIRYQQKPKRKQIKKELDNTDIRPKMAGDFRGKDSYAERTTGYNQREYQEIRDVSVGCSNPNYTWHSLSEKLQQNEQFHIKRPTINSNTTHQY